MSEQEEIPDWAAWLYEKDEFLDDLKRSMGPFFSEDEGGAYLPDVLHPAKKLTACFKQIVQVTETYCRKYTTEKKWTVRKERVQKFWVSVARLSIDEIDHRILMSEPWGNAISPFTRDGHLWAPELSLMYVAVGRHALEVGDIERATRFAEQGYQRGLRQFPPRPDKRFSPRGTKGGEAKARSREELKNLAAQLLIKSTPKTGWASKTSAFQTVAGMLEEKYSDMVALSKLKSENLARTVNGWAKKDPKRFKFSLSRKPRKMSNK